MARAVANTGYRFTAITPESHRRVNARPGAATARDLRGVFGWSRPFQSGLLPPNLFGLMEVAEALEHAGDAWRSRFRLASVDDLLFLHSAFPTDGTDAVFFGPDTYRFIAALRQELSGDPRSWQRAADIGSGSGAAGIVLARIHPEAMVVMTDINPAALRLCRVNAALANTANVDIRTADLLEGVEGRFDLIVGNPPYLLDPAQRLYRHGGGERGEGLSLAIVEAALARLAPGGRLLLYTGVAIVEGRDLFREAVAARLEGSGHDWCYREIDPDVFGEELAHSDADRIAAVFLTINKAK